MQNQHKQTPEHTQTQTITMTLVNAILKICISYCVGFLQQMLQNKHHDASGLKGPSLCSKSLSKDTFVMTCSKGLRMSSQELNLSTDHFIQIIHRKTRFFQCWPDSLPQQLLWTWKMYKYTPTWTYVFLCIFLPNL